MARLRAATVLPGGALTDRVEDVSGQDRGRLRRRPSREMVLGWPSAGNRKPHGSDRPVEADVIYPKGIPWTTIAPPTCPKR